MSRGPALHERAAVGGLHQGGDDDGGVGGDDGGGEGEARSGRHGQGGDGEGVEGQELQGVQRAEVQAAYATLVTTCADLLAQGRLTRSRSRRRCGPACTGW